MIWNIFLTSVGVALVITAAILLVPCIVAIAVLIDFLLKKFWGRIWKPILYVLVLFLASEFAWFFLFGTFW